MKPTTIAVSAGDAVQIPDRSSGRKSRVAVRIRREKSCRHCEGPIPLFRSLLGDVFCTHAHERAYTENIEELAVERLKISAERLKASQRRTEALVESF